MGNTVLAAETGAEISSSHSQPAAAGEPSDVAPIPKQKKPGKKFFKGKNGKFILLTSDAISPTSGNQPHHPHHPHSDTPAVVQSQASKPGQQPVQAGETPTSKPANDDEAGTLDPKMA